MSEIHLQTGDPCPARDDPALVRVYSMRFCPFAQRTRLVLAHKNIPHEVVNVNLRKKPEWLLQKNPLGLVPTVEIGDKILYESTICGDYLDEVYPDNKLNPADPYEKAQMRMLMDRFGKLLSAHSDVRREPCARTLGQLMPQLQLYEDALSGTFFGGNTLNMLDVHIWPWFEKFQVYPEVLGVDVVPCDKFPKLNAWIGSMQETKAAKLTKVATEHYVQYLRAMLNNEDRPYDIGLKGSK